MGEVALREFVEVDSTSLMARREIAAGRLAHAAGPVAFLAASQTGGVGRFGRAWSSLVGGLWLTVAWPVAGDGARVIDGLGLRVGVACVEFVRGLVGERERARVMLKWPNDVVMDGRKVCGALCEVVRGAGMERWVLVGVGLNANFGADELPRELRETAGTLRELAGVEIEIGAAARALAGQLGEAITGCGLSQETLAAARRMVMGVGQVSSVSMPTGEKTDAVLIGLDEMGQAVFRRTDGIGADFSVASVLT
jgi:BirA family biotin operon repressor/biotin-[acetyl-CoA-carboxylase] ligase